MNLPPLILASASPRRSELLSGMQVDFTVLPSVAEELHHEQLTAREICQLNAYRKARAVAKLHPDALVLGADTLVHIGTRLYGKPADLQAARSMLRELQGREHLVTTGVCLLQLRAHRERLFAETTRVRFRALGPGAIDAYLRLVNPLDKAGAYAVQEHGDRIIEEISGSYTNVVGLPVERLGAILEAW